MIVAEQTLGKALEICGVHQNQGFSKKAPQTALDKLLASILDDSPDI